ncbi:fatty acid desaturase [Parvularcula flava]|uniref:Fatty acid desaturase n=1 Tax=Aquisalinus luteolus TaxID=1566827 RepID=A0A8J3A1N4_9PROT|nr:fatty acid desaturase [Aquisalinus luteolus]NHK26796.1 fatty acid desaturase [Aquisalinus luteolus]GGH93439.1 hypothetical protein GCM10011355_05280 [Aquisalinus luteolus]
MAFVRILDLKNFKTGENKIRANRLAGQYMVYNVDWTSLISGSAALLAIFLVFFWGVTLDKVWQKALLGATAQTWLILFCFNVSHDVAHDLIFKRNPKYRMLNNIFGYMMATPTLTPYHGFKETHLEHHRKTNTPVDDPNHWIVRGSLPWLLGKLLIAPFGDYKEMLRYSRVKPMPHVAKTFFLFWIGTALFTAALIWLFGFTNVLFMWLIPAYINYVIVFAFVAVIPHRQSPDAPGEQVERIAIFPSYLQSLSSFLHAGHNYHLLHHMYPRVPSHKYAAFAKHLVDIQEEQAAERKKADAPQQDNDGSAVAALAE